MFFWKKIAGWLRARWELRLGEQEERLRELVPLIRSENRELNRILQNKLWRHAHTSRTVWEDGICSTLGSITHNRMLLKDHFAKRRRLKRLLAVI